MKLLKAFVRTSRVDGIVRAPELLVYPAVYVLWRQRELPGGETPLLSTSGARG